MQQLQADKAAALHEVHELKLSAAPVSGEFVSNKPLPVSKPRWVVHMHRCEDTHGIRDVVAELEASSTPTAETTPKALNGTRSSTPAPLLGEATTVADAVQRLRDMGLDDGHVPEALRYYAAAAAGAAGTAGSAGTPVPAEVVAHPRFQEVLAWLQRAGIGPEDVAAYLARQQLVVHEQRPTMDAHADANADDDADGGTAPLRAAMAHFADAGMPPALVVAALQTTPDGAAALAAHPLQGLEGEDAVEALQADTPEARGAAALQFAAVLGHLEEEGVAPGDLATFVATQQRGARGAVPDASSRDVLPVRAWFST